MPALQAAALPDASSVKLPVVNPPGIFTAAIGLSAVVTALRALTMPAPQVAVVHAHSTLELELFEHCATPAGCGNGVALALILAINCAGVRLAFTERMRAATPLTIGAEKLVPRLELVSSLYELAPGVVDPSLIVVSMERKQALPAVVFTQFPAGAATPTSVPRLL